MVVMVILGIFFMLLGIAGIILPFFGLEYDLLSSYSFHLIFFGMLLFSVFFNLLNFRIRIEKVEKKLDDIEKILEKKD